MLVLLFFEEPVVLFEATEELGLLPSVHGLMSIGSVNSVPEVAPVLVSGQRWEEVGVNVHNPCSKDVRSDQLLVQWLSLLTLASTSSCLTAVLRDCCNHMLKCQSVGS